MTPTKQAPACASKLTRRSFIKATTAAAALAAGSSLTACAPAGKQEMAATGEGDADTRMPGRDIISGEWKTAACWHNCGGRCLNKVLVKDGRPVRQKTDDTHEDSPDYPQQRGCLRGRSQTRQVLAEDRLKYPLKRKSWSPDAPNGEMRGKDEWERISWDEALDYVAEGLRKAKEQAGSRSILLSGGWNSGGSDISRVLGLYGGYTEFWNTNSFGAWSKTPFVCGFHHGGNWDQTINDRFDLRNSEIIVMLSMNPAWSAMGSQTWNYWQAKQAGARFICIDPFYNDTYSLLEAEWLPVRPATDMEFMLAVAYAMLEQDADKKLIDWDFLDNLTVGFDADHMPADAKEDVNFKDYVLGAYDETPKTPEWAEQICGVEAAKIRELAVLMGKDNKVAFLCGMASGRVHNVDNLPQLVMTLGAMGGHMGKSGHMTGSTMHATSGNGGDALIAAGSNGVEGIENPVDDSINANEVYDAILGGSYNWTGAGHAFSATQYQPGEKRDIDIRVIYHPAAADLQTSDGMKKGIEAHRKVDMVVTHAQFFTTNARYSDIILPVTTEWEKDWGFLGGTLVHSSNREMMVHYTKVIDPLYECKSDGEIAVELAKRLGVDENEVAPLTSGQMLYNTLATMTVLDSDGKTYVPAVAITADDIEAMGAEGDPVDGKLEYKELRELGVYQVKREQGDNYGYIAFEDYCNDPVANPLDTPSGKLEIYCQTLADLCNSMGWNQISPIPTYQHVANGYEDTFSNWEAQEKGEYPLQVINPHYLRRSHTVFDNVGWLREAWANPVFLNTSDATEKGIADGDTVLVSTAYGQTLRNATLTQCLRPGVVAIPHGAWVDVDEETGVDRAGADNYLSGQVPNGLGTSGFNSVICNIEKYAGEALGADVDQPLRIVCKDGE